MDSSIPIKYPWRDEPTYVNSLLVGIGLGGAIFGAVHCTAWNLDFPTATEQFLWRLSSVILTVLPMLSITIYWATQQLINVMGKLDYRVNWMRAPIAALLVPLYILARIFLLVEIFRQLAYLPPSAFVTVNWPSAIPHAG